MDLTVIITVADDVRIKKCIESIDRDVEILVVLDNSTEEVKNIVKSFDNVKFLEISEKNLGLSRELAIKKSKFKNIFLMDSDCIFGKGCIEKTYQALKKFKIVKCHVIFSHKNLIESVISKVRDYITYNEIKAFAPGLAFRKDILKDIGNYFFDEDIHWVEDSELNNRIKKANIKIGYIQDAIIYHSPLTIYQDLRSAFRYGCGKRIGVEKGIMNGIGSFFFKTFDVIKKKGFLAGLYITIWNITYCLGYLIQAIFDIYHIKEKLQCEKNVNI